MHDPKLKAGGPRHKPKERGTFAKGSGDRVPVKHRVRKAGHLTWGRHRIEPCPQVAFGVVMEGGAALCASGEW